MAIEGLHDPEGDSSIVHPSWQLTQTNISYADDISQIVTYPGKFSKFLAKTIEKEIKSLNNYEHKWKIKTNTNKFTLLPIAIKKYEQVNIDGNVINYSREGNILDLHLNTRGYSCHIKHIKNKANAALSKIKRFKNLRPNIKIHLVKACVLSVLTYPAYPLNSIPN